MSKCKDLRALNEIELRQLLKAYQEGIGIMVLANRFNISDHYVRKILKRNGIYRGKKRCVV